MFNRFLKTASLCPWLIFAACPAASPGDFNLLGQHQDADCAGGTCIRVMTYNLQLFPRVAWFATKGSSDIECRAPKIGPTLLPRLQDRSRTNALSIVAFQETFASLTDNRACFLALDLGYSCEGLAAGYLSQPPGFFEINNGKSSGGLTTLANHDLCAPPHGQTDSNAKVTCKYDAVTSTSFNVCSDASGSDCLSNKGTLYTLITLNDQLKINVFNTHLDAGNAAASNPNVLSDRDARHQQVDKLVAFINTTANPDWPTIIMGDFNFSDGVVLNPTISGPGQYYRTNLVDKLNTLSFAAQSKPRDAFREAFLAEFSGSTNDEVTQRIFSALGNTRICTNKDNAGRETLTDCSPDSLARYDYIFMIDSKNDGSGQYWHIEPLDVTTHVNPITGCNYPALGDHKALEAQLKISTVRNP